MITNFCIILLLLTQSSLCMETSKQISTITKNDLLLETIEQKNNRISQLLENPNFPKRLTMEVKELRENKNFVIDLYPVISNEHPFEIKIIFHDDQTIKHTLICQMPDKYPFRAPILSLTTDNNKLNAEDLIIITKSLDDKIANWSPQNRIREIVTMADETIKTYMDKRITSHWMAKTIGYERDLTYLKDKYQSINENLNGKYLEFQKKFDGLWIKTMPDGYLVFHVEGDYINITFEPKYTGEAPLFYYGEYAAGYYIDNNDLFKIAISDDADSGKINNFQIIKNSNSIKIMFFSLHYGSTLNTIVSKLKMDYIIGKSIELIKIH
ncbi:MAG TPA: hypothetical protein VLB80_00595 [Candidatus Babeliales bacterium]|nr:hypothetical protein [Candidatus Babeliales bacterium]